ncbi:MAG: phospholipase D family protein [Burkholderiales bacterium]|nr:phospholipase D family protein [Burkholderiales bacterium]
MADPAQTDLGQAAAARLSAQPGASGFHVLDSGLDALAMRAGLADAAQRTLDLQYYALIADTTTQLLIHRVIRAAKRGVRVRLLVDDLYAVGKDLHLAALASGPNIEVRVFNPFMRRGPFGLSRLAEFLGDTVRLNRRMHNKLWIADNAAAIIGGRNLGDAYFDVSDNFNFCDLDMLAVGPVVRELSLGFDEYWNSAWSVPIEAFVTERTDAQTFGSFEDELEDRLRSFSDSVYARALRGVPLGPRLLAGQLPLAPASAVALYESPAKMASDVVGDAAPSSIAWQLRALVENAKYEVILISPYLIPSQRGIKILKAAAQRGVKVRALTNSLATTDVPVAHAGYARVRPELLALGTELHELRPYERPHAQRLWIPEVSNASLHTKAIVVDRRYVLVGSMNLDPRSRHTNTEVAVLIDSTALAASLRTLFEEAVHTTRAFRVQLSAGEVSSRSLAWLAEDDGKIVRRSAEPASASRRLVSELLYLFTPDELL